MENNEAVAVQVVDESISLITKAEIDMQISTAKAFPRSLKSFRDKVKSYATINEDVAESCGYALERQGKKIIGPSVRFAEIVINSYGNIRSGARVIANDGKTITAQGICHDLESNSLVTVEVKRKITNKQGVTYSEDMQVVTGNAACAIAFRNAVFKVVPTALTEDIFEEVMQVAKGTIATLEKRRLKALEFFDSKGVKRELLYKKLGVNGPEDIDLDKLSLLTGFKTGLKNGDTTIAELFEEEASETDKRVKKETERLKALLVATPKEGWQKIKDSLTPDLKPVFDVIVAELNPTKEEKKAESKLSPSNSFDEKPTQSTKPSTKKEEPKVVVQEQTVGASADFMQRVKQMDENTLGDYNAVQALQNTEGVTDADKAYLNKYLDEMLTRG